MKKHHETQFIHTPKIEAALDRAIAHHQGGQLSKADRIFRSVLSSSPNHPMALNYLGVLTHQLGKVEPAIRLLKKAVTVMPDYAEAQWNLATVYAEQERWSDAEACCRTALKFEPSAPPLLQTLADALRAQGHVEESIGHYRRALAANPNSAMGHNNLGSAYYTLRKLDDAVASYMQAVRVDPGFALAQQNLANVLREQGRTHEAIETLNKVLALEPDNVSARHNLDALTGRTTDTAPKGYVKELFDPFAQTFETHLQDKLHYVMPALMRRAMGKLGLDDHTYGTVVDLGCGTGLAGIQFKDLAKRLVGIDLSKNMIREAEAKGVYDELLVDDIEGGLKTLSEPVDICVCADVFVYVGKLEAIFDAVRQHMQPGALLVFSTEHLEDGDAPDGFKLRDTSRYGHTKAYIDGLASRFGFSIMHFEQAPLRKEKSGWITGTMYVLKHA